MTFEALAPPFFLLAALLMVSGAVKVLRPQATAQVIADIGAPRSRAAARGLGAMEIAIGLWASVAPATGGAAALAVFYLAFAGFLAFVLRTRPQAGSCGCAGATAVPPSSLHLGLNVAAAGCALAYAASAGPGSARWITGMGGGAVLVIGGLAVAGWLAFVVVTEVPAAWRAWVVPVERDEHGRDEHEHEHEHEHASAEDALASAGIRAGHPSLWPAPAPADAIEGAPA